MGRIEESVRVFDEMPERDVFAWTTMISGLVRVGDMSSAGRLFDMMPDRNLATWNTLIDGYARLREVDVAELLFNQMPARDIISWTTMINCYSQNKRFREALGVFNEMAKHGIGPDEVTMATVISACAHLGALDLGKEIHYYIMQHGFKLDVYIGSALIDMYAKCGSLDRSLLMFFKLQEKNLFCWNSVIEGLAVHGYAEEALAMFEKMEREKIKPNGVTFVSVLSACNHAGLIEEGRKRFASMTRDHSIPPGVEHYGCMVDLLSKAGLLEEALQLIRTMKVEPNAVIWGALLSGCKLHRNLEIAQVAANKLMVLEPGNSGYYTLMVNMNAEVNRWGEAAKIRLTMKEQGVEKRSPGSSWIEMESQVHQFAASDKTHAASDEIYSLLAELDGQMKLAGYEKQRQWSRGVVQSYMKKIVENSVQKCRDDSGSRIVLVVLRDEATETRKDIFYGALYIIALAAGSGGTKPSISTMGADQFDVYIQDNVGWTLGYALPTLGLAVSIIVFLVGTPFYRHKLPAESPLTRMAQVLVAAVKKWKVPVPDDPKQLHELSLDEYIGSGKELTIPLLLGMMLHVLDLQYSI
uniref:Pentatricopeptide repeat-containing family protein n=1 Tax=Populus alba TaxID=43335 RepID=A0A4U5QMX3_POPAL|nr:pentatricopeptide repeat-containing family protein [Populus alba]